MLAERLKQELSVDQGLTDAIQLLAGSGIAFSNPPKFHSNGMEVIYISSWGRRTTLNGLFLTHQKLSRGIWRVPHDQLDVCDILRVVSGADKVVFFATKKEGNGNMEHNIYQKVIRYEPGNWEQDIYAACESSTYKSPKLTL